MEPELLRDICLFVAVARAKSFSRAADGLGMQSSTLSRRVSALESRLGLSLFCRNTRQLELTDTGARYLPKAESVLHAAELAHGDIAQDAHIPRGTIRISMPEGLAEYGSGWLAEFAEQYPDIAYEITTSPTHVDPTGDNIDISIRDDELESSSLIVRRLATIPTTLYASPAYLERAGIPISPSDLVHHSCIRTGRRSDRSIWTMRRQGESHRITVTGRMSLESIHLAAHYAKLGLGIARSTSGMVFDEVARGLLVPVLSEWEPQPVRLSALTTTKLLPAKSRTLLQFLMGKMRQMEREMVAHHNQAHMVEYSAA